MNNKKIIKILAALIVFIFIANFLANKFYWYYSIWYFDMIMHTLGGIWLGFTSIYLFKIKDSSVYSITKVLLFVLCVGLGWEVFEIVFNNRIAGNEFNYLDTVSDVFCDLTGGVIALLYNFKISMFVKDNAVKPASEL